jgi:hypothetical protein
VFAVAALVGSIANSGYNSHENRAPEARIVLAALASLVGFAAVCVAVQRLVGRGGRVGWLGGLLLTWATALLIFVWMVVVLGSGPL